MATIRKRGQGMDALLPPSSRVQRITIDVGPLPLLRSLEDLLATGLFGVTLHAVCEEMVRKGVREAILAGWAEPPAGLVAEGGRLVLGGAKGRRRRR